MASITLEMEDDLAISLAAYARLRETSVGALVSAAVDHYLRTVILKLLTPIGIVSDGSVQSDEVGDWINEHWLDDIVAGWESEPDKPGESAR